MPLLLPQSIIGVIIVCTVFTSAQLSFHQDAFKNSFSVQTPSLQQTYTRYYGGGQPSAAVQQQAGGYEVSETPLATVATTQQAAPPHHVLQFQQQQHQQQQLLQLQQQQQQVREKAMKHLSVHTVSSVSRSSAYII